MSPALIPNRIAIANKLITSSAFAHIAARSGANVTILHRRNRPLNNFDPYLIDMLVQRTRELGAR